MNIEIKFSTKYSQDAEVIEHQILEVGDEDFYNLSYEDQKDIVANVINKCPESTLCTILQLLCVKLGDVKVSDLTITYTLND